MNIESAPLHACSPTVVNFFELSSPFRQTLSHRRDFRCHPHKSSMGSAFLVSVCCYSQLHSFNSVAFHAGQSDPLVAFGSSRYL